MKRLLLLLALVAIGASGAPLSPQDALEQAQRRMAGNPVMKCAMERPVSAVRLFPDSGGYSVCVVQLSPRGYLVLNMDDRLPLIVSFSAESVVDLSDTPDNAFRAMLLRHVERMEAELALPAAELSLNVTAAQPPSDELHGPFLETTWNQCNPYNLLCPDAPAQSAYYGYRTPSGCTPTAYAQVLQYHRWPLHGSGSSSYTDYLGSTTGTHSADYSDPYDWGAMLTGYDAWSANGAAAEAAVAELMYELGVAAEANYESSGTSSSVWTLGQRLGTYFYFEPCSYRSSLTALIDPMEADLRAGLPCVVAIPGHAIVADGLMISGGATTYHINYGWGGSNNGWWSASNVAGAALQYGVTALRPRLMAFPETNAVAAAAGGTTELHWILPKRREAEAAALTIYRQLPDGETWEPLAVDTNMASRRFSAVITEWDDCDDLSLFEITSTSTYKDWVVSTDSGVDHCFYKEPGGYSNRQYHLTSRSTITPTAATRLLLRGKYNLASDRFRVSVSIDRSAFTEIWSASGAADWSGIPIDLSGYAGQPIYLRIEYVVGSFYSNGGIWIDSIAMQEVSYPELEGQPVHYTTLTNLPAGTCTLAAAVTDSHDAEHELGPPLTLTVSGPVDDGDGMPAAWEQMYGLNPEADDGSLDPDHDGYSNLQEYICDTVPTNAASCWRLQPGPNSLPAFHAATGRLYTVFYRTHLVDGSWLPLVTDLPGSNGTVNVDSYDARTDAVRYYRVEVRLPD